MTKEERLRQLAAQPVSKWVTVGKVGQRYAVYIIDLRIGDHFVTEKQAEEFATLVIKVVTEIVLTAVRDTDSYVMDESQFTQTWGVWWKALHTVPREAFRQMAEALLCGQLSPPDLWPDKTSKLVEIPF